MRKRIKRVVTVLLLATFTFGLITKILIYSDEKSIKKGENLIIKIQGSSRKQYENTFTYYTDNRKIIHNYNSYPYEFKENNYSTIEENYRTLVNYNKLDSVYTTQRNIGYFTFKDLQFGKEDGVDQTVKETPKPVRNIKREQEKRRAMVKEVCYAVNHDNSTSKDKYVEKISMKNFYLARSASTMTCLLNKVASTSVAVALLKADGRAIPEWNENLSPHNAIAVLNPQTEPEFKFVRKYFFKFLLVRHPFERLLSAYRDKVERANHWSLRMFRAHIIETLKNISKSEQGLQRGTFTTDSESENLMTYVSGEPLNSVAEGGIDRVSELQFDKEIEVKFTQNPLGQEANDLEISDNTFNSEIQNMEQNSEIVYILEERPRILEVNNTTTISEVDSNQNTREELQKPMEHSSSSKFARNLITIGQVNTTIEVLKLQMDQTKLQIKENITQMVNFKSKRNIISPSVIPTFREFLEYILLPNIAGDHFTSHWSTYWETCSPCSIPYDVIAKLESAEEDLQMVHERMGLPKNYIIDERLNKSPDSKTSKDTILASYYGQLDPIIIGRVYRRFALDFQLFDYDIMDVFRLAGHCRTSACSEMRSYL